MNKPNSSPAYLSNSLNLVAIVLLMVALLIPNRLGALSISSLYFFPVEILVLCTLLLLRARVGLFLRCLGNNRSGHDGLDDDGLDDDYIGDEQDRRMLESLTEREREEEFYRRTEKREELKKRSAVLFLLSSKVFFCVANHWTALILYYK